MAASEDIVIVGAARTPVGSFAGAFGSVPAHELGAVAIKAALERAGVSPDDVDEVIFGHDLPLFALDLVEAGEVGDEAVEEADRAAPALAPHLLDRGDRARRRSGRLQGCSGRRGGGLAQRCDPAH